MYAYFESILRSFKSNEGFYTEKHQDQISCSFPCKPDCVDNKFSKRIAVYRVGNAAYRFIQAISKELDNEKVRDHSYITEKYRGAAHWSCNVNLKLTIKVFTIFHNLKGYDSHLIMNEIGRLSEKKIT